MYGQTIVAFRGSRSGFGISGRRGLTRVRGPGGAGQSLDESTVARREGVWRRIGRRGGLASDAGTGGQRRDGAHSASSPSSPAASSPPSAAGEPPPTAAEAFGWTAAATIKSSICTKRKEEHTLRHATTRKL